MMPWFTWKGTNSAAMGLWINKLPPIVRAQERTRQILIPGRTGIVTMTEGEDVYENVVKTCTVIARNDMDLEPILKWLRGSGEVSFSNEYSYVYFARIAAEVSFARISNDLCQAKVVFDCQPLKGKRNYVEDTVLIDDDTTIYNPGNVKAYPKITINALGAAQVMSFAVNGSTFTVDFSDMADTGCIVYSDAKMVVNYSEVVALTEKSEGDFPVFVPGENEIEIFSGITSLEIEPNWRWV